MAICAGVDVNGFIIEVAEIYPQCSELAILDAPNTAALTYWADLSVQLEPTNPDAWALYLAILMVFITAFGVKQIARLILNR